MTKDVAILQQSHNLTLILKGNDMTYIEDGAFQSTFFYSVDFGGCIDISVVLSGMQGSQTHILKLETFEDVEDGLPTSPAMLQGLCNISVKDVNLQKRHFQYLSSTTFQCLTKLQSLDLTYTYLKALPPNMTVMNTLKELILSKNSFQYICNISSATFPSLTHLYIKKNSVRLDFGSGCLENLSKLQHLDLSNSYIASIDCCSQHLKGLSRLQHLNLSYNEKLHLKNIPFQECGNLELLDLAFTLLHIDTPSGPFQNLHHLRVLNLSYSSVNTSIQGLLQGLKNLVLLNFSGNKFESGSILNGNLFQQAPSLEVLILSSCELTAIQDEAFHTLRKLKHADLSYNKLTTFNTEAFFNLKSLYLNFANNKIHIIPRDMLTILSGQSIINLSYNPLECTCSNIDLLTWYKQNMDKIEDLKGTVCSEPASLAGVQLSTVTLSCGISITEVVLIVMFLILIVVILVILRACILKRNYQQM